MLFTTLFEVEGEGQSTHLCIEKDIFEGRISTPPPPYSGKVSITVLRIFERHCRIRYATLKTGLNIAISCHKLSIASYTDISIDAKEPQETLESLDEPMSVDSETRDQNRPPDGQDSETKMDEELTESTKGQDGKSSCASCTI